MVASAHRASTVRLSGRRYWITAASLLAAIAVVLLAWERQQPGPSSVTTTRSAPTVTGAVVIKGGPTVMTASHSDTRPVRSVRLRIVGVTTAGTRITRHTMTDGAGRFASSLPPGVFTITAVMFGPASRPLNMQPHQRVVVRRGHPVHVQITGYVIYGTDGKPDTDIQRFH
jgi:hypothetical protein